MRCLFPVFFGTWLAMTAQSVRSEELIIGTWNLQHLAAQDNSGCRARSSGDYLDVAKELIRFPADIWLFQEVENEAALKRILPSGEWEILLPDDRTRGGYDCEAGGRSTPQNVAIALRKTVKLSSNFSLTLSKDKGHALRNGEVIRVEFGGGIVEILNVHLKASCSNEIDGESCETLFWQLGELRQFANGRARAHIPIIGGVDFNMRLGLPNDLGWQILGGGKDLELVGSLDAGACWSGFTPAIDHFVTNSRSAKAGLKMREINASSKRLSDHCMKRMSVSR